MSVEALMVHTVTIVHPATQINRYGALVKDWDNASNVTTKAWISRRETDEHTSQGREAFLSDWIGFFPLDITVTGSDRIIWQDITFEVVGAPNYAWSPHGVHHIEAGLHVVDG